MQESNLPENLPEWLQKDIVSVRYEVPSAEGGSRTVYENHYTPRVFRWALEEWLRNIPTDGDAVALLRARGVVIWIDAHWETLRHRLQAQDDGVRPLVDRLGWAGLEALHRRRRRLYAAAADFRLRSGDGPAGAVARTAMLRSLLWERRREGGAR